MASDRKRRCKCPTPRVFARLDNGKRIKAACLMWSCPVCSLKRRAELALRTRMAISALLRTFGGHAQFLTLTLDPKRNLASAANGSKLQAQYVSECWRSLNRKWKARCRRRGIPAFWYLKVPEWRATSAAMHLHVIVMGWIPSDRGMKEDIVSSGFGPVFDIGPVKSVERLTRYVTTYVTKTSSLGAPRYVHRYSASGGALPPVHLWKRLIGQGLLDDLKAAAQGKPWFFEAVPTDWWTGETRALIEAALEAMEASQAILKPKVPVRWLWRIRDPATVEWWKEPPASA